MGVISAAEFEQKCIKIVDEVAASGEKMLITRNGVAVAELVPVPDQKKKQHKSIIGAMKDSIVIYDDLVEPVDVEWEVQM